MVNKFNNQQLVAVNIPQISLVKMDVSFLISTLTCKCKNPVCQHYLCENKQVSQCQMFYLCTQYSTIVK